MIKSMIIKPIKTNKVVNHAIVEYDTTHIVVTTTNDAVLYVQLEEVDGQPVFACPDYMAHNEDIIALVAECLQLETDIKAHYDDAMDVITTEVLYLNEYGNAVSECFETNEKAKEWIENHREYQILEILN